MYPLPPNTRTGRRHIYVEAFCQMRYRDTADNEEWIWNSRDGVTPFCVTSRQGLESCHVEWQRDVYVPNLVPELGSRIFVDLTPDRAVAMAGRIFDRLAADDTRGRDFREQNPDRPTYVAERALELLKDFWPHTPELVEVDEEIRKQFMPPEPAPVRTRFA